MHLSDCGKFRIAVCNNETVDKENFSLLTNSINFDTISNTWIQKKLLHNFLEHPPEMNLYGTG